jgi:hypothetical protein
MAVAYWHCDHACIVKGGMMSTRLLGERRQIGDARRLWRQSPLSPRSDGERLGGDAHDRALGARMAELFFAFGVAYAFVTVAGFASLGNVSEPLPDPYLGIVEGLIIAMAPVMVMLVVAIYACAPSTAKTSALVSLVWMLAAAATTIIVHVVLLTVGRRLSVSTFPGYSRVFSFAWPSVFYAVDIVAWDVFVGLSLLFAARAFRGPRDVWSRRGLLVAGLLCLVGLVGPAVDNIAWRGLGILGYAVVLPVTCLAIRRSFLRTAIALGAAVDQTRRAHPPIQPTS